MEFNKKSRKFNSILAASSGVFQQMIQIIGNFAYRTVFLMILSREYLGIQGLFVNILQLFSLTELGVGEAILYSMYKPVAQKDIPQIGALVRFYKRVYYIIAGFILLLGLCLYPFIETLVDISEVPADVNLRLVYMLFLLQSVASYLFANKLALLQADQNMHISNLHACGQLMLGYVVRTMVLFATGSFEKTLAAGIALDIITNWLLAIWIGRKYAPVFAEKGNISREDKNSIFKHTFGLMCHKVGKVIVNSTDNIVLTKYVSLAATGMYSNYATLTLAVTNVANRIFWGLQPSITNYTISRPKEDVYLLFKRILFGNLWFTSFTTVCLFLLLNPFITLWLDESYLFETRVVAVLCLQHYLYSSKWAANAFVNSTGLFSRDKIRPLIESALNLSISIILAKRIGIAGVFVGTCVSGLLTYFWREPYLVFKNFFGSGLGMYWVNQVLWAVLTVLLCVGLGWISDMLPNSILGFVGKMMVAGIGSNAVILLLTFRTDSFHYFLGFVLRKVRKFKS